MFVDRCSRPKSAGVGWVPSLGVAFRLLLAARLCSVFCMHISDCDETYNYWEPFHYIIYGSGQQTWEYSPVYALRSYGYIVLHAVPLLLTIADNKLVVFFLLRVVLAVLCTLCEFYFYRAVLLKYGGGVAKWMLLFLVCGCGMYISSTAFLPSSFSMYFTMLAMGAWLIHSYELAIFAVAVGAILGWPFSAALGIPIAVDILLKRKFLFFLLWSCLSLVVIAGPLVLVDSIYYGKLTFPPLNIVLYNMFGKGGPSLYGVQPWTFYLVNGFLNFNLVFVLALMAVPILEARILIDAWIVSVVKVTSRMHRLYVSLLLYSGRGGPSLVSKEFRGAGQGMLIWLLVFGTRPHKEERFLFPIYPLFCLNAAVALAILPELMLTVLRYLKFPRRLQAICRVFFTWLPSLTGFCYTVLSLSRILALYQNYHAPMYIYRQLNSAPVSSIVQPIYRDINLCVGKEWYRYPSSFFLPGHKWKLQFLQTEFRGQLPQPFGNKTWDVPKHMNDMNMEEKSRYFPIEDCDFLVDLDHPETSKLEPRYSSDQKMWKLVAGYPFLDASKSHWFFRAFYLPILSASHTVYRDYVLLLNKLRFKDLMTKLSPDFNTDFI